MNRPLLPVRQSGRDYATRPNQATGRSSHDYGNTRLGPVDDFNHKAGTIRLLLLLVAMIVVGVLLVAALSSTRP